MVFAVGCRIGFDPLGTAVTGHDEDGDGVPDLVDVCPHIAGPQVDTDGDGVGDACDPEPANPRQHRILFAAMTLDDQPFAFNFTGVVTQMADSFHADGNQGGELLDKAIVYTNVQISVGADIAGVVGPNRQHQIAVVPSDESGVYVLGEINERVGQYQSVDLSSFDGSTFTNVASSQLQSGIHAGHVDIVVAATAGGGMTVAAGWPGEPYAAMWPGPWQGGHGLAIDLNNLVIDINYVDVVSW